MVKYMYEIKDTKTRRILTPVAVTAAEAEMLLDCSHGAILDAYHRNHLIKGRYMVDRVDIVIPKSDSIWMDWDLRRCWLLKICKGGRENANNSN